MAVGKKKAKAKTGRGSVNNQSSTREHGPRADEMKKRREFNRNRNQLELLERLRGIEYIRQLEIIDEEYADMDLDLQRADLSEQEMEQMKLRLSVISNRKDALFKKLAKLVGDMKVTELSDPDGNNPLAGLIETFRAAMDQRTK